MNKYFIKLSVYGIFFTVFVMVYMFRSTAQIPRVISYQGVITDSTGRPILDGMYVNNPQTQSDNATNPLQQKRLLANTIQSPIISVTPDSMQFVLTSGDSSSGTITISNTGTSDLLWSVGNFDTATVRAKIESVVQELRKKAEAPAKSLPISQSKKENIAYSWSKESAINVVFKEPMDAALRNVALVAAESPEGTEDVQQKLIATGMFNSVTAIEAQSVTPTVDQLKAFDAVLVWSNNSFADTQMIGDNLADYIDAGGGVVTCVFAGQTQNPSAQLGGRFNSQNYWVISPGVTQWYQSTLGTVYYPDHPVMKGVQTFDGGYYSYRYYSTVVSGGSSIADWTDGLPLIAERKVFGVNRIDLGFYPPSSTVYQYFWDANTDGAIIMANALCYAGVKFVKLDPTSGNIVAGGNQTVNVKVNSQDIFGGSYRNVINIESNDPVTPVTQIPVRLEVTGAPNIVFSTDTLLYPEGYVGYPDTMAIIISNDGNDLLNITSFKTDNNEFLVLDSSQFSIAPNHGKSIRIIYTRMSAGMITGLLTVSSNDPDNPSAKVEIKGSAIYPPIINLFPSSIPEVSLNIGDSTSRLLTLSNTGGSDLKFGTQFVSSASGPSGFKIKLPDTLYDASGFMWDIDEDGRIKSGTNNVYNEAFDLDSFYSPDSASTEANGREIVIGPVNRGQMEVIRKVFVPHNGSFVRYLEIFNNNTSEDLWAYSIDMRTSLGHYSTNYFTATSSGDKVLTNDDNWVVLRDSSKPYVPAFVFVIAGSGDIVRPDYIDGGGSSNYIIYTWNQVEVPAGGKAIIMHFGAQRWSENEGIAAAEELMNLEGEALRGMSIEEMSLVKNFKAQRVFTVSPDSGAVQAGSSEELSVGYSGKNVASGTYEANLRFISNDPATPMKDVPISLKVQGYPHISVSKDTINFGDGLVGYPDTMVLRIYSSGNAPLNVTGMATSNPEFAILDSTTFTIDFNLGRDIRIQCKRSAVASLNEELTITSNDASHPILTVRLLAATLNLSVISFYPDSLGFSLLRGDTAKGSFIISNTGQSNLRWHVRNFPRNIRNSISESLAVALVAADGLEELRDVKSRLLLLNRFRSVTIIQANIVTPTLAELRDFDAVLVWSGGINFANGYVLGDNLAAYIDEGGGVVMASESGVSSRISGRFNYDGYWVIYPSSYVQISGQGNLGTVYKPNHPLMEEVSSLHAECPKRYFSPSLISGSSRIADWTDGSPLIAERKINGVNRVDLNLYPPSSAVDHCSWDVQTNGAIIIANALSYVGRKIVVPNPSYGTVAAGSSDSVALTVDAKELAAGRYDHRFVIESNDPLNKEKYFAVGVSVSGNPEINIDPTSFVFSLNAGDSAVGSMQIKNPGTSNLEWGVEGQVGDTIRSKIKRVADEMRRAAEEKMASGEMPKGDHNTLFSFTPETAVSVAFSENHEPGALNVLLLYYDSEEYAMDVRNKLLNTGFFNSITCLMEYYATPTVAQLQSYDAVLVWSWGASYTNSVTLGNNLADYVDSGGGVVMSFFTGLPAQYGGISGRFSDENYWAIAPSTSKGMQEFLGKIYQPDHPVMRGVHSFDGGNSNRYSGGIVEGAARIADWSDGTPLVAEKTMNGVSRIDLGFYPPSSTAFQYGWVYTTDGTLIMANALKYVAKKYTSLVPYTGMIVPGDSQTVSVKIKTDDLIGRVYNSTVNITSNDTIHPSVAIPVQLTLSGFPAIGVDSNALNFGIVYQGTSDTLSMNIINSGTAALSISNITSASSRYSVVPPASFSIPPRSGHIIRVVFTPSGAGVQSSTLTIVSDAVNNPNMTMTLIGNGILPPEQASPQDKSTNISRTEILRWHPAYFAAEYHLQVAEDSLFTIMIINDSTLTDTSYAMPWEVGTTYYWHVKAKSPLAVSEWSPIWQFTTRFQPNVYVSRVDGPPTAYSGQDVELRWIVGNMGAVGTNVPSWMDRVYLFPDTAFIPQLAIEVGDFQNVSYLSAGESYSNKTTFRLPIGITGNYYIFVRTDFGNHLTEFDETNNLTRSDVPIFVNLTPPPDLRVLSITAPSNSFSGEEIEISWSVKNLGTGSTVVERWWDGIYVSPDSIFRDSSARGIGAFEHTGALLPDSGYSSLKTVKLPDAIYGKYYLFIKTDYYNNVYENVWESNNKSRTDSIWIALTPPPDLTVTSIQAPLTGNSGQPLSIRWTVQNEGPGSPFEKEWSDRIYLSRISSFNPDSVIVIGSYKKGGILFPDSSYTVLSNPIVPNGLSGIYYLFVKTDWDNQVFEYIYEGNNVIRSDAGILVSLSPWPDLQISSIQLPSELTAGQRLTIKWDILNAGLGSTASSKWVDNIYLSDTSAWLPMHTNYVGSVAHTTPLAASLSVTESLVVTLSPSMKGTYYVYVSADAQNSVYEHTDENNNVKLSDSLRILPYPPVDLAVISVSNDTLGFSGQPIKIRAHIENTGSAKTLVSDWLDAVYLSSDTMFNASEDIFVASIAHYGQLLPNVGYSREEFVNLPNGISGTYYLYYRTDTMSQVGDIDLKNNVKFSSQTLSISLTPSPDFAVTLFSAPAEVYAGQPLTIQWTVQNQGSGPNYVSTWSDGIYLSADSILHQTDYVLGIRKRSEVLEPGSSYAESLRVDIPVYLSGDYFLLVYIDNGRNVYEHLAEGNNIEMITLKITIPPPSDLIVTNIDLPDTAECGQDVTITWTISNQGIYSATGWIKDAVYISSDLVWQPDDPLFGMNYRYIDLAPGASVTVSARANLAMLMRADSSGTITGEMPGVTLGDYHAIVRTDIRNNIRESNDLNNSLLSSATMNVDVPLIEVGVPESAALTQEQFRYYRVHVASDLDLNVNLASNISEISNEVYVAYDRAPTLNDFDYSAALPFTSNQQLIVPTTKAGTYYILILGRGFPAGVDTEEVSILATALPLSVLKISPVAGGLGGLVSCRLDGAGFREGMMIYLRNAEDSIYGGTVLKYINSTECDIRWNLEHIPLGRYDVVVKNPDSSTAYLPGGFAVEALRREGILAENNIPEILPGRFSRMHTLHLAHTWNIDLPYLIVQIAIPKAQSIEVYSDRLRGFKSMVPDSLKHLAKNYYNSGDWRFVPLIARDVRVGEIVQLNIALQNIQYEHHYLPIRILVHAIDKSVFTDAIESQIDLARQLVLQDPSKWDSVTVTLAHDSYLFRNNMMQFYVSSGIFDKDQVSTKDFKSMAKEDAVTAMPGMPPGGGFGKVTCEILCGEVVACAVSILDCTIDLGLGPFGGIIAIPTCIYGVAASCVFPAFGYSTGAAGCLGLASGLYCTTCATACPYVLQVCDPNDIRGPKGYGDEKWISQTLTLPYTIRYENDPTKATAPVKMVIVTLPLDSTLDARTFRLGSFGFGSFVFTVPENRAFYSKRLNVRDSLGVFVDVNAGIDLVKNEAFWILKSIDPATGQSPMDPLTGFLPVDDSLMHGQGFLNYTVRPKSASHTLQKIEAVASIVFDLNEPLNTPKIFNTIDADKPTSRVHALTPTTGNTSFTVAWSGVDSVGSGIQNYTIYISVDDSLFTPWLTEVADTSAQFTGVLGNKYAFYSIARDNVGNVEQSKISADTYTIITGVKSPEELPKKFALYQNYPNPFNPITTIKYDLPTSQHVIIKIYNLLGQEVITLVDEVQEPGYKYLRVDASNFASGLYFYRINAGKFAEVKKMLLMK